MDEIRALYVCACGCFTSGPRGFVRRGGSLVRGDRQCDTKRCLAPGHRGLPVLFDAASLFFVHPSIIAFRPSVFVLPLCSLPPSLPPSLLPAFLPTLLSVCLRGTAFAKCHRERPPAQGRAPFLRAGLSVDRLRWTFLSCNAAPPALPPNLTRSPTERGGGGQ